MTTLVELVTGLRQRGHEVQLIEPSTLQALSLSRATARSSSRGVRRAQVARTIDAATFDAIHIATEGPLGSAARAHCLKRGLAFTTAFHTRFPYILSRALHIPESWGYAWFRRFHATVVGRDGAERTACSRSCAASVSATCGPGRMASTCGLFEPWPVPTSACRGRCSCTSAASRTRRTSRRSWSSICRARRWSTASGRCSSRLRREHPRGALARRRAARRAGARLQRRRRVRVPEPQRDLRPGDARGDGLRHAGRGLSRCPARWTSSAGTTVRRRRARRRPAQRRAARARDCRATRARARARRIRLERRSATSSSATWCRRATRAAAATCHGSVAKSS